MLMPSSSSSSKGDIKCEQCGVTFTTQQDKKEHMKTRTQRRKKTYWCELVRLVKI
jgi:hypothetical protein